MSAPKKEAGDRLPDPVFEGAVLKKCRRNGEERPWKRRWFMLISGSLLYHHSQSKSDPIRLFTDVSGAEIQPCDAPSGFGIAIRTSKRLVCFSVIKENERDAWLDALIANLHLPPVDIPDDYEIRPTPSGLYRVKSALASAFATSALGKHLIRKYLDDAARNLIATVLDFTEIQSGRSMRSKLETYIFDVASRIAVIVYENTLPPALDTSTLYDETVTFCQLYVRYSRDRRLAKERQQAVEMSAADLEDSSDRRAYISDVDTDQLLRAIAYVTSVWRSILQHNVSDKTLDRFDFVVDAVFQQEKLKAIFEDTAHRQHMADIEYNLRELMETF
eukprot:m.43069 g.43069  ORF g.43069 m.43069 type:complete len:332 (+) comp12000_c0_seq1:347-1342(+)